jgi:hypothetical protein
MRPLLVLVATTLACSRPTRVSLEAPADASPCDRRIAVASRVVGSWRGDATDESRGSPHLVVEIDDPSAGSSQTREIARLPIASPFFAAEVGPSDLCADDGSTPDELSIRCIADRGEIVRARVHDDGHALRVRIGDAPATRWQMAHAENACFDLHGLDERRDLEAARAAWGRDMPSARCEGKRAASGPVRAVLDFPPGREKPYFCAGGWDRPGGATDATSVRVSIPSLGIRKELGALGNQCGGLHVTRFTDADAIALETSDMGLEKRFAYRLGDRLYVVGEDDRIAALDLPCGARVVFDVRYPWREGVEQREAKLLAR